MIGGHHSNDEVYDFTNRYKMLLEFFPPERIVVVQTADMLTDEGAMRTVARIANATGFQVPKFVKSVRNNNADHGGTRYNSARISEIARNEVKRYWYASNKQLEEMIPGFQLHPTFHLDNKSNIS